MRSVFFTYLLSSLLALVSVYSHGQDSSVGTTKKNTIDTNLTSVPNENRGLEVGIDFDNQDPQLDALYIRGPYLVYDCYSKHWVCTGELEYKRCLEQRKEAILDMKYKLPCASFEAFRKRKDCYETQQELTNTSRYERFCLNADLEENRLDF